MGGPIFARFESVQDNFGNSWVYGTDRNNYLLTTEILRPGDRLTFIASAYDPLNEPLYYSFKLGADGPELWQIQPQITINIMEAHIKTSIAVYIKVKNGRGHYAHDSYDSLVEFRYTVSSL